MKRFRIAMVAACPFPAAFASAGLIRELTIELNRRGHDVHVITYHLSDSHFPIDHIPIHRIPNVPRYTKLSSGIALTKPLLDILLARTLYKTAHEHHFDIIHTHNYEAPPAGFLVRSKLNIPVVYHAHNTMVHELPTYFQNRMLRALAKRAGNYLDKLIPCRADHIITVSPEQTAHLESLGIPRTQMTLMPPCVSPDLFADGDGSVIRNHLGLENSPIILYTGGLQPYQNCEILIQVLKLCLQEVPDIHLLILARSEPQWLQDKAIAASVDDRVHFLHGKGLQFERDCLAAADVGLIPRLECIGFPVKLLNYISAGIPVVCFQGLNKGFVNERDVLAAPSGDVPGMAHRVIRLIRDKNLKAGLTQSARHTMSTQNNWDTAIASLEDIYQRVISVKDTS